jgi:hypothetical protein
MPKSQSRAVEIRRLRRELRAVTRDRDMLVKGFEILVPALGKLSKYGSVTILVGNRRHRSRRPQTG